jgi:hypothetical protein
MIRKLLPIVLLIIGVGGGIGAGLVMKPAPVEHVEINPCGDTPKEKAGHASEATAEGESAKEYVKLNNQFVVPVVTSDKVESLVVLSLSVEVNLGQKEAVFAREPKLRDAFLQVLFDHANMGGFRGAFTNANNMEVLRNALRETAHDVMGELVSDVLIVDIARQDV